MANCKGLTGSAVKRLKHLILDYSCLLLKCDLLYSMPQYYVVYVYILTRRIILNNYLVSDLKNFGTD